MKNANTPAHPFINTEDPEAIEVHGGLTKREAFAMAAMQGILSFSDERNVPNNDNVEYAAMMAVKAADFLLKQLES